MKLIPVLALALLCGPVLADRQTFPPVDEADRDPSLIAFRDALLASVAARDIDAVVTSACADIYLSHGSEGGPPELRASLSDAAAEDYWTALQTTLSQPGYFDDQGEFWMPHQWQITLPADLDPTIAYFVTGENVTLRQGASSDAPILALISHEVVLIPQFQEGVDYQRILLTDGTPGFMHRDFLWSMTGYRAALVKSETGTWQLCSFVTGD